ncbi:conserved hypothetical protein [Ricinus communis]|uniref:Uncharacterized protein n=1 Tax=Ricinus communis TaxID=3988 RepID=B9SIL9_RICCO|nr:conserved hypothetical protein [Ricinus communis]
MSLLKKDEYQCFDWLRASPLKAIKKSQKEDKDRKERFIKALVRNLNFDKGLGGEKGSSNGSNEKGERTKKVLVWIREGGTKKGDAASLEKHEDEEEVGGGRGINVVGSKDKASNSVSSEVHGLLFVNLLPCTYKLGMMPPRYRLLRRKEVLGLELGKHRSAEVDIMEFANNKHGWKVKKPKKIIGLDSTLHISAGSEEFWICRDQ